MWAAYHAGMSNSTVSSTGVARACTEVMRRARHVDIDDRALRAAVDALVKEGLSAPDFDRELHYFDGTWRSANFVLVLDALNFSFWPDSGQPRWTVHYRKREWSGYWALTAALQRAVEDRIPILEAKWLAEASLAQIERVLAFDREGTPPGHGRIPLMDARHANLQEVGRVLVERYDGRFIHMVEDVRYDAVDLTLRLAGDLTSFNDVASYGDLTVPFFKRAQITPVDLYGTFNGKEWGKLQRLDQLTAFADYKVPQVLRRLGILEYDAELREIVDHEQKIPAGHRFEVEIRAATVDAVERMRERLREHGQPMRAFELDWVLWNLSQRGAEDEPPPLPTWYPLLPYHKTRTIFY